MVLESEQLPLIELAFRSFVILAALLGFMLVIGYLATAVTYGPFRAVSEVISFIRSLCVDWMNTSPRRVYAMAWLAFKESIRRKVVVVFIVFVIVILFAGWFLDFQGDLAAKMYVNFVFMAMTLLMLLLAVVLSTFSLPSDIRDRTIFTIVSKPVRRHEIILGKILGFVATSTVLLLAMGIISMFFVVRGLHHTHVISADDLVKVQPVPGHPNPVVAEGRTARKHGHRHEVKIRKNGDIEVDDLPGHSHVATEQGTLPHGENAVALGDPVSMLRARVPVYGTLRFKDRDGEFVNTGINVGKEWTYKSCIEGASKSVAIWTFEGVSEADFPTGEIPLELSLGVFRTYKGEVNKGIYGSIVLRNPQTGRQSNPITFEAKEFYLDRINLESTQDSEDGPVDLFDDLVSDNGTLEVEVRCDDRAQYFCMARADVYLHAGDSKFLWNFVKGNLSIWLQVVMIIAVGVACSSAVRGTVAMLFTIVIVILGWFVETMESLGSGQTIGGGPAEAALRIYLGKNPVVGLEEGARTTFIHMFDSVLEGAVFLFRWLVPNLLEYNKSNYVAEGYNIPPDLFATDILSVCVYVIPVILVGHIFLKLRQVA